MKKLLKDKTITEDEDRRAHEEIQKMTDGYMGSWIRPPRPKKKRSAKSADPKSFPLIQLDQIRRVC